MRWHEALRPVVMQRVALAAPAPNLRSLLVEVADEGTVELDDDMPDAESHPSEDLMPATSIMRRLHSGDVGTATVSASAPDLRACEASGRLDLIGGEAQLEARSTTAVVKDNVAALVGWMPGDQVAALATRVAGIGAAILPLPRPTGVQPPTLLPRDGRTRDFAPLVETYATVPYVDVNPTVMAGLAYVVMFGMMFADAGHGALLVGAALLIRSGRIRRLARLQPMWLFVAGGGLASVCFGVLYGEFFGPTGALPVLWLEPLSHPVRLLGAAVAAGGLLLAGAYGLGTVNRFREGGWRHALYAPSGLAGAAVFLGLAALAAGLYLSALWLTLLGGVISLSGLAIAFIGLLASAGGGAAGAAQAGIEVFDLVVRLGSNLVSFARLAAFGLTHAALGLVIWQATSSLWPRGTVGVVGAVIVFLVGNAVAFALEGLVAGIQALRLEYYELFSRIFDIEGRPFRPWHIPLTPPQEAPC
jgi:V/A-type H+/Na+-transporting ATPase subunit I